MDAVDETVARPDSIEHKGDKFIFLRRIDSVLVEVQTRADLDPPTLWTAFPRRETR